jgi:hypothetical protein
LPSPPTPPATPPSPSNSPGAYTATVTGKARTTGVALVEVYELP